MRRGTAHLVSLGTGPCLATRSGLSLHACQNMIAADARGSKGVSDLGTNTPVPGQDSARTTADEPNHSFEHCTKVCMPTHMHHGQSHTLLSIKLQVAQTCAAYTAG